LISGDRRPIDIVDMKRNVNYASGYHESQPYIQAFWEIGAISFLMHAKIKLII
jgi:hypothetical protein